MSRPSSDGNLLQLGRAAHLDFAVGRRLLELDDVGGREDEELEEEGRGGAA